MDNPLDKYLNTPAADRLGKYMRAETAMTIMSAYADANGRQEKLREEAKDAFGKLSAAFPELEVPPGGVNLFGKALSELESSRREMVRSLRETAKEYPEFYFFVGQLYFQMKKYDLAEAAFRQVIGNPEALGYHCERQGKKAGMVYVFLGNTYLRLNRLPEAIPCYRTALETGIPDEISGAIREFLNKRGEVA